MIFKETKLSIIDNSGAKEVLVIRCLRTSSARAPGYPGDRFVTTIKIAIPKKTKTKKKILKRGEIHKVLLVSCRKNLYRQVGHRIAGIANTAVILKKDNPSLPFGNRLKGPIFHEARHGFAKILFLAPNIL